MQENRYLGEIKMKPNKGLDITNTKIALREIIKWVEEKYLYS